MTDYEHIVISAVRYAIGRMTYIVSLTVDYVLREIKENKLSDKCLFIIKADIEYEEKKGNLGMECDKKEWKKLLEKIDEIMEAD